MNNQEAKFLLRAYRPDGRDARDPAFAEALAQAERDPALRAWLEREQAFDATVTAKISTIHPPAGLREAILAGVRASQPRRRWWANPALLAAAAAVTLLLAVTVQIRFSRTSTPSARDLAAFAIDDLANAHDEHVGHPPALAGIQAQLTGTALPMPGHLDLSLGELKQKSCRTVSVAGRDVLEVCFERDGSWFHLYAARIEDFAPGAVDAKFLVTTKGQFAATAWKDSRHIYALVTSSGSDALKRLL